MECNKPIRNIRYVIFRESNLNRISNVWLNRVRYMNGELFIKLKSFFFSVFGPIFLHFRQIFQNGMPHFFENGSTTIFHFLLSKVFETYQVYYTILFIDFEFTFPVSLKHIFYLPKKPQ